MFGQGGPSGTWSSIKERGGVWAGQVLWRDTRWCKQTVQVRGGAALAGPVPCRLQRTQRRAQPALTPRPAAHLTRGLCMSMDPLRPMPPVSFSHEVKASSACSRARGSGADRQEARICSACRARGHGGEGSQRQGLARCEPSHGPGGGGRGSSLRMLHRACAQPSGGWAGCPASCATNAAKRAQR